MLAQPSPIVSPRTELRAGKEAQHMNETAIWGKACELLREEMSEVSYNTWVQASLKPIALRGDTFYVETVADYLQKIILARYGVLIANALSVVIGHSVQLEILNQDEAAARFAEDQEAAQAAAAPYALNPKYTFNTFVVGNSNRFAHAASLAVAESPADAFNPLFIYGGVGLGKTHLMHAIGHHIRQQYPSMTLLYISSENFTNELISAIQRNKNAEFRNRFRNVDVLMVDDIQFIGGRDSTQEEFFHTFNTLYTAGKQIIISSDKPPQEIKSLEERLVSRFQWGLITDIQKPDIETRIAILRKKAESEQMAVDTDVLNLIASLVDSNIRELEGTLTRVVAYSTLSGRALNLQLAEEALRNIADNAREQKRITVDLIQQAVAEYYEIPSPELKAKRRDRKVSIPRQVAMFLTRSMTELSLTQIGDAFDRDHTTVLHACDKITDDVKADTVLAAQLDDIRRQLTGK